MMKTKPTKRSSTRLVPLNNLIPGDIAEEFDRYISEHGYLKGRAIAAAIRIFMASTETVRIAAMRGSGVEQAMERN